MPRSIVRRIGYILAATGVAIAAACKSNEQKAAPDTPVAAPEVDSAEALAYLAAVDQAEVQAGQIGTRRASSSAVRQYAQLLWREHAQSGRDVAELARQLEIDLRAAAPQSRLIADLRTRSEQTVQQLNRTPKSAEFDRLFLDSQVRAHQAVLQDLRRIIGDSSRRVSATLAPGGGIDVGVTGRVDAAAAAAAANRAANRKAENALDATRMMLGQVQQHLERARQLLANPNAATASPPPPSTAPAARRRSGARR